MLESQMASLRQSYENWVDDTPELESDFPTEEQMADFERAEGVHKEHFAQLEHRASQIYRLNDGAEFNVNSPRQVARVLFGEDGAGESTNKDVLEAMASAGNEMA